jgi:hypothetical protein
MVARRINAFFVGQKLEIKDRNMPGKTANPYNSYFTRNSYAKWENLPSVLIIYIIRIIYTLLASVQPSGLDRVALVPSILPIF